MRERRNQWPIPVAAVRDVLLVLVAVLGLGASVEIQVCGAPAGPAAAAVRLSAW